jgi:uncharacterized NAD(P)/FAD-binding protein YdhS
MRRSLNLLSLVHLRHATDSSTAESGVLVAVAPAVHSSLDEASLASKGNVKLSQSPANTVAISLVHQAVAAILILGAACSRVDTVLLLEFGG